MQRPAPSSWFRFIWWTLAFYLLCVQPAKVYKLKHLNKVEAVSSDNSGCIFVLVCNLSSPEESEGYTIPWIALISWRNLRLFRMTNYLHVPKSWSMQWRRWRCFMDLLFRSNLSSTTFQRRSCVNYNDFTKVNLLKEIESNIRKCLVNAEIAQVSLV